MFKSMFFLASLQVDTSALVTQKTLSYMHQILLLCYIYLEIILFKGFGKAKEWLCEPPALH